MPISADFKEKSADIIHPHLLASLPKLGKTVGFYIQTRFGSASAIINLDTEESSLERPTRLAFLPPRQAFLPSSDASASDSTSASGHFGYTFPLQELKI